MNRDYNLNRMKGSGDDCNCETLTRDDVGDKGLTTNEMRSRIQGIADSHDSSPTLRLSEEIKRIDDRINGSFPFTNEFID